MDFCHLDQSSATLIQEKLPSEQNIQDLAEFIKVFGDATRLKILFLLKEEELCVHDISQLAEQQQAAVSHHLKILRHLRLVKFRREGRNVIYSLNDEHIAQILEVGLLHTMEEER